MAPLTRFRADDAHVPLPMVTEYYAQRASVPGTLLITEATFITPRAGGYRNVPGIWSQEQIQAWRKVTSAVHEKKSFIFLQLWALGRAATAEVLEAESGDQVVSSSDVPISATSSKPRPLSTDEIAEYVKDYAQAAKNAIEAGFDGVEIHGANGYLVDQFIQDTSNRRLDRYGGSIENRSRFAFEVSQAVSNAIGPERVGIRLSPFSKFQAMRMADPVPQFTDVIQRLKPLKLAYVHFTTSRVADGVFNNTDTEDSLDFAVNAWGNTSPVLLAGGFQPATAFTTVDKELPGSDIGIVFGRSFISTPDLPYRIRQGIAPNPYDRSTFYKPKSEDGYTDYPFSPEFQAQAA